MIIKKKTEKRLKWQWKKKGAESEKPERAEIFVDVWNQDRTQDSGQKLILI